MKKLLLLLFISNSVSAQTLTQQVNASGGGYYTQINGSMQFTIGEPLIETYSITTATLTQGFEQGSYVALAITELPVTPAISVDLFPNPTNGIFNLFIKSEVNSIYTVKVMDAEGKLILNKEINNRQQETIDITAYSSSMYFVVITDADKKYLKTYKIIKQ
jgi:hypothetical protein